MRSILSKLVLAASVLAIVGGVMLAPVQDARANPLIPCEWNVPPADKCDGWCPLFSGKKCATALIGRPDGTIGQICVCAVPLPVPNPGGE